MKQSKNNMNRNEIIHAVENHIFQEKYENVKLRKYVHKINFITFKMN